MNTIQIKKESKIAGVVPAQHGGIRDWQHWAPYAAVAWSLIYALLGISWAASRRGFPYSPETVSDPLGPLLGRFVPAVVWIILILAGIPAAAMGIAMLRGVRGKVLRPVFITAGALLAGVLLLLMTSLNLLVKLGYLPIAVFSIITGAEFGKIYIDSLTQWVTIHQFLCMAGGFLWLAATVCYARQSTDACLYCGRRDGPEGWSSPENAARWGRIAVYIAMVVPIVYALIRYVWALGFPLGTSEEQFRISHESPMFTAGAISLGTFCLVGAVLMLGLVQRWGEVFPRWVIGLAGRRVPIALVVVLASLASVLLIVGGIGIWSDLSRMIAVLAASGTQGIRLIWELTIQVGPTLLFPVWGLALAVATLGYYYRRRGPCRVCGRGETQRQ